MPNTTSAIRDIVAVFGAAFLAIAIGFQLVGDGVIAHMAVVWVANIVMIGTVYFLQRRRGESLEALGVTQFTRSKSAFFSLLKAAALTFLLAIVAFVVGSIVMANITGIPESSASTSYSFLSGNLPMLLVSLAGVFVASSFGEELVYRGFLILRVEEIFGSTRRALILSVAISSIVFGLAHYEWGPMGIAQTTGMGAALGYCWIKAKRDLWVVILAHALMDFILLFQMYLA